MWIEAPDALHQALSPQHLVTAANAAVEIIGDVKERTVAIGDASVEREQVRRHARLVARGLAGFELFDCALRPYRPVPEQAAADMGARRNTLVAQIERQHQV